MELTKQVIDELANRKYEIIGLKDEARKLEIKQYKAFQKFNMWLDSLTDHPFPVSHFKGKIRELYLKCLGREE